jgi:hypothetical protein
MGKVVAPGRHQHGRRSLRRQAWHHAAESQNQQAKQEGNLSGRGERSRGRTRKRMLAANLTHKGNTFKKSWFTCRRVGQPRTLKQKYDQVLKAGSFELIRWAYLRPYSHWQTLRFNLSLLTVLSVRSCQSDSRGEQGLAQGTLVLTNRLEVTSRYYGRSLPYGCRVA